MILIEVDPTSVTAGLIPLALTLAALVVLVLLYRSMRKHIRFADELPTEAEMRDRRRQERKAETDGHQEGPDASRTPHPVARDDL